MATANPRDLPFQRGLSYLEDDQIDVTANAAPGPELNKNFRLDLSHNSQDPEDPVNSAAGISQADAADEILPPGIGQYEDFHTIDWQRDLARDRMRHRYIVKTKDESLFHKLRATIDAGSGWLCVLIVGMTAGCIAGVMDIGTAWLSDLKDGVCADAFWFNREHCCWSSNDTSFGDGDDKCPQWHSWAEIAGVFTEDWFAYFLEYFCYVVWAVSLASLSAVLVREFAPYACGAGIAEIKCILSGFIMRGFLGKWTLVIKSVGLMLSVASGLSLGKEGPMVHLGCCIGNIFSYLFPKYGKNEAKKREILSAACAAGISVAFGAPIGGVLFSLEEASYYFPLKTLWRSFFCALIAGLFLRLINPFGSDQTSLFSVDYPMKWAYIELIPFVLLGVLGGLLGTFFIKVNIWYCGYRKTSRLGKFPIAEVLCMALLTGIICFPNHYTRISSVNLIKSLFGLCHPEDNEPFCDYVYNGTQFSVTGADLHPTAFGPNLGRAAGTLFLAMVVKLVLTTFTIGMKVPAGLFIPSKAIGAIAGRLSGVGMQQISFLYPVLKDDFNLRVSPGLYAVVGAAAMVGGVTRMTVALVVIMFELTGSLDTVVPCMAAVMFAKWVGDSLCKEGICDAQIVLNSYPFLDNKEEFQYVTKADAVIHPKPGETPLRVITQDTMTVADVEQLLRETDFNGFPVVVSNESQYVVGFVTRRDLSLAINNALKTRTDINADSIVLFTPDSTSSRRFRTPDQPKTLRLRKLLDLAPITITDQTPMETVIDMFRKLGLRQVLVIHNGRLLGIITKKDVLRHIKDLEAEEKHHVSVLYRTTSDASQSGSQSYLR